MNKCSEVMTKDPVCCLPHDPVVAAAILMKTQNIGPVPVVEDERTRKLVGIVTDRDLVVKVVPDGRGANTRIQDVMTREPVACRSEDNLGKALAMMSQYQVRRLPIIDADGRLLGIISQADVALRIKAPKKTARLIETVSGNVKLLV